MKFKPYPKYKVSGVEWLGDVPGSWDVKRLGFFFKERREKVSDKDFEPLSVTKNGILPQLETAAKTDDGDNRKKVCSGDFVINSRSDRKGSSGAAYLNGSVSLISIVLEPRYEIDIRFAHHLMRSHPFQEEFYRYGKGIVADLWSTSYSEMRNISLGVPSLNEQSAIAAFLDRETAKIDTLITKQETLIKLLKEKRQAVISHAVTKGLDPNVPMKPSGVEWLGDVPEHWRLPKIGYHADVTKLTGFEYTNNWKVDPDGEIYALRGFNIGAGRLNLKKTECISSDLSDFLARSKLFKGDIVMPCTGTLGAAAVIEENDKYHINQNIAKIHFNNEIAPYFAVYWLTSKLFCDILDHNNMSGMQPVVLIGDIRNIYIPLPPLGEQQIIVDRLNEVTGKIDTLITKAQQAIALQKEHRTALISAAVTGKIDVRNEIEVRQAA